MTDKTYRFIVDLKAHTDAGTESIRRYRVAVRAASPGEARRDLATVAYEQLADDSDLLDGNLLEVDLCSIQAV